MEAVAIFRMFQTVFDIGKTNLEQRYSRRPSIKEGRNKQDWGSISMEIYKEGDQLSEAGTRWGSGLWSQPQTKVFGR